MDDRFREQDVDEFDISEVDKWISESYDLGAEIRNPSYVFTRALRHCSLSEFRAEPVVLRGR